MLTFKNHEVPILHSLQLISSLEMHNGSPCNQARQFYSRAAIKVLSAWRCPAARASCLHPPWLRGGSAAGAILRRGSTAAAFPASADCVSQKLEHSSFGNLIILSKWYYGSLRHSPAVLSSVFWVSSTYLQIFIEGPPWDWTRDFGGWHWLFVWGSQESSEICRHQSLWLIRGNIIPLTKNKAYCMYIYIVAVKGITTLISERC